MAISINGKELRDFLKSNDLSLSQLSAFMNRSPSYISFVIRTGTMSDVAYDVMCKKLGVAPGTFRDQIDPAPMYRLSLTYSDSKVLVQLMRGEEVVSGAWAIVKEQSELGFIQAISYAAHMMYKFAQQDDLNKEELA